MEMDKKIFEESGVFTRFLGTELEKEVDGQTVKYKFPLPVEKTENSLQRQILPADMVLRDFSNLTTSFQEKILNGKGIPVMNGKFLAIFMWDTNWGQMRMNLSSITKGSRIEQKEAFEGRGNEVLDGSDIDSTVTNGAVFPDGTWRMDVSFLTGQTFSYWGKSKSGWMLEGCFTCLGCAFTANQCLGRVFLMPDQLTMEQSTQFFIDSALEKFTLPEDQEPTDERDLSKYKKHLMKLERTLKQMGSLKNPKGTKRSKKFNGGASDLFFNEDFGVEAFYEKLKNFINERFGAKERHSKRQWNKMMMKIMAVCEYDMKRCPEELRKFESKDQIRLMNSRL